MSKAIVRENEYGIDKFKTDTSSENHISLPPMHKMMRELFLADTIAMYSKDPSSQIGAVLVPPDLSQRYTGYNGFPFGDNDDPADYANREVKYGKVIHAEDNAIRKAVRLGESLKGWYIFVNAPPCSNCSKLIAGRGVSFMVCLDRKMSETFEAEKIKGMNIMKNAGVEVAYINPDFYNAWVNNNPVNPRIAGKTAIFQGGENE